MTKNLSVMISSIVLALVLYFMWAQTNTMTPQSADLYPLDGKYWMEVQYSQNAFQKLFFKRKLTMLVDRNQVNQWCQDLGQIKIKHEK